MELVLYEIKCEEISCGESCDPKDVFICSHPDCINDESIYCQECITFKHRKKNHEFDPSKEYINSIKSLYEKEFSVKNLLCIVHCVIVTQTIHTGCKGKGKDCGRCK